MITDHITSERPEHHWALLNVAGGTVLDLGCGYNDDEARQHDWSTPRHWYLQGAANVIGIDANPNDVARVKAELPGTYFASFVSVELVEQCLKHATHIKSDCEGGEAFLFCVPIPKAVQGVSIECHSPELADTCRKWIAAGGLTIIAEQPLHDHRHIVVITAVRELIPCVVAVMNGGDARLRLAQSLCVSSLQRCLLKVVEVPGTPRPRFGDMLRTARVSAGTWFAWVNSDCQLLIPPSVLNHSEIDVLGMRRVEIGPGTICAGVDGYLIRTQFWDDVLSLDVPEMWTGGTHVDWWLSRAAQRYGRYAESVCLAHLPHDRTSTSLGIDEAGRQNIANYEAWAARHGVSQC